MEERLSKVLIKVLIDNRNYLKGLKTSWGLSIYIEAYRGEEVCKIIFDVGANIETLKFNAQKLGVDLKEVSKIVISHWHYDHASALEEYLSEAGREVIVYAPIVPEPRRYYEDLMSKYKCKIVECKEPTLIFSGVLVTGGVSMISGFEQALLLEVEGLKPIIIVGCTHPGISIVLDKVKRITNSEEIHAIIGGLHIISEEEGLETGRILANTGVEKVIACHCTSTAALRGLRRILGDRLVVGGVGYTEEFKKVKSA